MLSSRDVVWAHHARKNASAPALAAALPSVMINAYSIRMRKQHVER
jgi:hypothetical protein